MTATSFGNGTVRVLDDRYRLRAEIGSGATAHVLLADDLKLRRQVAIKFLHPALVSDSGFLARFEHEAQSAAALSHPHVLAVYDWGDTPEGPYLVTEFLGGGSLHAMLAAGYRLSAAQVIKVGLEAASGLAAAHRRGMVHRDVKPANLMFDDGGRLRIGDFGLVQALNASALTDPSGLVLGTWRYAAPERAVPGPVDGRTDVYSLAASLIEAFTGLAPGHEVSDPVELLAHRATHDLVVPEGLGAAAAPLARAGAADPAMRPTADELMRDLVAATEHFGPPAALPLVGATRRELAPSDETEVAAPATELLSNAANPGDPSRRPRYDEVGPSPRRAWWLVAAALVIAAAIGVASQFVSTTTPEVVPVVELGDLRFLSITDVRALADENGWLLDEVQVRSDGVERGTVIRQSPTPESQLARGAAVVVDVVTGPRRTMVPWVVGLTEPAAVERLESRQFVVVAREPRFDEVVPAGVVMDASIDGTAIQVGRLTEPGTAFELVVSDGPVPRTIPAFTELTIDDAMALAASIGVAVVEREPEFSDTVAVGLIIDQDVDAGAQVPRGSEVGVVVSKGPDLREVPDVSGLTIAEATDALESVGLVRSGVAGGGDTVESSSPRAGELLRPGDSVELWAPL